MRGRPITIAAICADILSRTLENVVLLKWKFWGLLQKTGKVVKVESIWNKKGKNLNAPGRLNDLRHIIYKSADTHWRQAKNNIRSNVKRRPC